MKADQAAGLRRSGAPHPLRCIHFFSDSADSGVLLAHAFHRRGRVSLLVDTQGRLFAASSPRSLFDWKHQLERRQLHTLPHVFGEGWYAPGLRGDEPALRGAGHRYDQLIFDSGWREADLALMPGAAHAVVMEIGRTDESMQRAYALLKTLEARAGVSSISLLGDRAACDQVQAAACRFLEQRFAQAIFSAANANEPFAVLAVRMAGEETSLTAC